LLLGFSFAQQDAAAVENPEQCMINPDDCRLDDSGHALLATKVTRSTMFSEKLPAEPSLSQQRVADIEQRVSQQRVSQPSLLHTDVQKQGHATTDQFQRQVNMTLSALDEQVKSSSEVQHTVAVDTSILQPFQGDNDPLAAREKHDRDYVRDGPGRKVPKKKPHPEKVDLSYKEPVVKSHKLAKWIVAPLAFAFVLVFTLGAVLERYELDWLPESAIMIAAGIVLGALMKYQTHFDVFEEEEIFADFNSTILNLVLLPVLMFTAGWSVRRKDFFSQFPYILLFATVGVAISTLVVAFLIHNFTRVTQWRTALAFGTLISATDPVATLATYDKLKVEPLLNIMVFGESVINDAVAIVVFNVFNADDFMVDSSGEEVGGWKLLLNVTGGILKIFLGSCALGIALGMLYTLLAHWADMRNNKKCQILNLVASCYLTYAIAEGIAMSGIISTIFAGLIMGMYMRPHLSHEGSLLATFFVKQLSMLADAAVCLLIGVSVVHLNKKGWILSIFLMLFCLVGRAASIFPLGYACNFLKRRMGAIHGSAPEDCHYLSPQHMFMMWHAGLRGAIALTLCLELGSWVDVIEIPGTRSVLQTATFFLICTFLVVFGGSTKYCLQHMGIAMDQDFPSDYLYKTEKFGPMRGILKWLDHSVFGPLLLGGVTEVKKLETDEWITEDVEELLKASLQRGYLQRARTERRM
jgi:sodium/hydrogen exchanger 8